MRGVFFAYSSYEIPFICISITVKKKKKMNFHFGAICENKVQENHDCRKICGSALAEWLINIFINILKNNYCRHIE